MVSSKKISKKIIALVLAVILIAGAVPAGVMSSVFAAQVDEFVVAIDGYDKTATVKLTQSDDTTVFETAAAENGKAVFKNFYDDEKSYNLEITDMIGYKNFSENNLLIEGNSFTVAGIQEIEKVTVCGTVTDENDMPKENAEISYSAYDGEVSGNIKTDAQGTYSFEVYKNIEYSVVISAEDKYAVKSATVKTDTDKDLGTHKLEIKQFSIVISVGEHGTVSDNNVLVNYGEDAPSIVVTADENYRIDKLTIDDEEISDASSEESFDISSQLKNVTESHNVSVSFYRPTYEITINYSENGEVKDNSDNPVSNGGTVILEEGSEAGFTAIPAENYHIAEVVIDGDKVDENWSNEYGSYTKTFNDNKKHSVTITFAVNTFSVTVNAGDNGTVTADENVEWNNDSTITIAPNDGYDVEAFSVSTANDVDVSDLTEESDGTYTYTISEIKEDVTVTVTFVEIETVSVSDVLSNDYYSITFSAEPIVIGNDYIVAEGESITIVPNAPYKRVKVATNNLIKDVESFVTYTSTNSIKEILVSENTVAGGWAKSVPVSINFVVDSQAPEITNIAKSPNKDYNNGSYIVTMNVTDDYAGVDKVYYSVSEDFASALEAEYDSSTGIATFNTTTDEYNGNYYIWAVDKVGNNLSSPKSVEIRIDNTAPAIDRFEFSSEDLDACKFGTFSKSDIKVLISASDAGSMAISGVASITFNDQTVEVNEKGEAEFTLTADDFAQTKTVAATATDNAGNTCEAVIPNSENSNVSSNAITISQVTADISITKSSQEPQYDNSGEVWYNGNNEFTVNVSDTLGIKQVIITMNDKEVVNETLDGEEAAITNKEYTINTNTSENESDSAKEGANEIKVCVTNVTNNGSSSSDKVYIDTTSPEITEFEFKSKGTSILSKALNFLTFGNFFNEKIKITVSAKDDNASSGLKEITLYGDEVALDTQPVVEGVATFVVPAEEITDETMSLNKQISAKATDNVDNQTADFIYPTTTNSETFANSGLMIETIKPTIEVTYPQAAQDKNSATADENDWYANDIDFTISVKDSDAGIRTVSVDMNGTSIDTDKDNKNIAEEFYKNDSKTTDLSFRVNTDQAERNGDGSYTLTITVTDNAGNVSEYTKTIYKDIDNPAVTNFKFEATGYDKDNSVTSADTQPVKETTYGFYFIEDTNVTITANDVAPTAGIKSITYYTVDKDGGKSDETTKLVDKNNQITFTVPANFKGQIYAKATDNVDNTPADFVNPNSAIVENEEQHKKTSSIKYTLKDSKDSQGNDIKDEKGNNLYGANTTVDVEIVDSYSGIRQIDWEIVSPYNDKKQAGTVTVDNDGNVTSVAKNGYSADCLANWQATNEDNLVTVLKNTITVSNNSNNIEIRFTLTDRAGNVTKNVVQKLSIDKTAPKIVVQMNENDDDTYTGFFKVNRTADIYVYERNFRSSDFTFEVTRTDDNNSKSSVSITPKFEKVGKQIIDGVECYVYKMSKTFVDDGDYTFKVKAEDFTEHKTKDTSVKYSNDKTADFEKQNDADRAIDNAFTIDKTIPKVSVSYDNNNVQNTKYFNAYRTATITVTEHNFTSENNRITYTRTSAKDGQTIDTPSVSNWSHNGNVHTATIYYNADGDYTFGIDVADKAGNALKDADVSYPNGREVSKEFTIDTTITKPTIGGVENGQSYKEEVIPTILIDDVNYAASTVQLLRTQKDDINRDVTEQYIKNQPSNRVTVSEDTFEKVQENDGIYTLNVSVTDLAGNTASDSVTFTVNRFGSVYEFSNDLVKLQDSYVKSVSGNIVITEYNPDRLVKGSLNVQITRDGAPLSDVKYTVNPVVNDTAEIGSSGWYQYDYVFDNANFSEDGIYTITVASEDTVGNKPETTNYDECDVLFRVDSTAPEFVDIKGLEKSEVKAEQVDVTYTVSDAIGIDSIVVSIDNISQESITEFDDFSNYTGTFTIGEGYKHDVKIVVTDKAGNITDTSSDDFNPAFDFNKEITVSTNIFVLWFSKKPLFFGSIAGIVVAAGLIIFLVAKKKKKNDDNEGTNSKS